MSKFNSWLDTLIEEKEIDPDTIIFEKNGSSGVNCIPLSVVLEAIKATGCGEQTAIRTQLVKIDFCNGNIVDYFDHLAGALAR